MYIAHGMGHGLTGAAVAAWLAVALVGSYELLMMVIRGSQGTVREVSEVERDADPLQEQAAEVFAEQLRRTEFPQSVRSALSSTSARHVHSAFGTTAPQGPGHVQRIWDLTGKPQEAG